MLDRIIVVVLAAYLLALVVVLVSGRRKRRRQKPSGHDRAERREELWYPRELPMKQTSEDD